VIDSEPASAGAIARALEARGHSVVTASSSSEADRHPRHFDCGVFASELTEGNGVALAGWFLAENRVRCAVFFSNSLDVAVRARASNLGALVLRSEGIEELCSAVEDTYENMQAARQAAGAEDEPVSPRHRELGSGSRRKLR
jgi:hypothetical protein